MCTRQLFVQRCVACENRHMTSEAKLEAYFFTALLLVTVVIVGIIFYPFIGALALALVLATLVVPFYEQVKKRVHNETAAALLVTFLVTCAIIIPAIGLIILLIDEAQSITQSITNTDLNYIPSFIDNYKSKFIELFPLASSVNFEGVVLDSVSKLGSHFTKAITSTTASILKFFVSLIALFYFIRDGKRFVKAFIQFSPLEDSEDEAIVKKLDCVTHSLIRGTLVIAVLQGIFVGVGFVIFGVPNPVLWGSVAAISALIPTLGTGLVSTPAIIFLFATGQIAPAIGLTAWSLFVVGLVDNIIGPKLIGGGAKIHPLFILISVLGGLAIFGISGFLLGPLIFGFLVALSEIYKVKIKKLHEEASQEKKFAPEQ